MTSVTTAGLLCALLFIVPSPCAAQAPSATSEAALDSEQPFIVRRQVDRVRYAADGTRVRQLSRDVQIQSSGGLEIWRDLTVQYAADRERVVLERLEIVKPSGERVRPSNLGLEDRRQSGLFDQKVFGDLMESHVTVPSLAVGDRLSYDVRIDTTVPEAAGAFWEAHQFYAAAPIDEEVLQVEFPSAVPVAVWTRPGQAGPESDIIDGAYRVLRWRRTGSRPRPVPAERSMEALMVEAHADAGPDVHVSSLVRWTDVGGWYRRVLASVAPPGPEIAAKARALTASASTPEARLEALYRFVASEVRYVSLAFGRGRHEPRRASLVLDTGYGDCKDKHTLLAALAHEIGITLDPVLIGAGTTLQPDAPSPAQFDHLISVWRRHPDPDQWLWLDSTSGVTGPGVLLPVLRAKQGLLVDGAGTFPLVTTPAGRQTQHLEVSSIGTLAADGAQQMTIRRLAGGDQGIMLRTLQPALQEANAVKQLAGALLDDDGIGSSLVSTATIDVPAAWEAPVDLSYVAQVKYNLADTIKKRTLWIPTPTLWLPDPDKVPLPWRLPFTDTLRIRSTTHYTLPEGWGAQPPVAVQLTQPFAQYRSRYAVAGRELTIERELDVSPFDLDEQHRVAYTRFRTAVLDDRAQQFGLTLPTASTSLSATSTADLNARGLRAFDARRFTEARDLFTALTVAEPNHPHAWNELGRTYLQLGEHEAARAALERQVAVDPLHPYAYSNLGTAYQRLGRVADAEQAYRKQIEIVPLDKWSHRSLGLLFLEQGRLPDAIAALERAVTITRDDRYLRLHLGRAYLKSGDITKAVQIFDEEASATPLYPGHLNDAAYWLAEAGVELPRARRWAERVVALTHGALGGSTLPQMRDRDLGPLATVVMVWDTLGWTAFHQNDLAAARLWLESAHAWSDSREIAVHAGTLREREGRPADALRAYRRAARGTKPVSGADAGAYATATRAIARLNASGAAAPTDDEAVDLASRQSTVKVPGLAGPVSGDVLVSIGTESTVDEALLLGDDGPQALIDAVQGTAVPGADIARLKQVRLFRRAAFACDVKGTCTLTWGRVP